MSLGELSNVPKHQDRELKQLSDKAPYRDVLVRDFVHVTNRFLPHSLEKDTDNGKSL